MNKQADLTNEATPGTVANTLNPFSAFYGGHTWAPKAVTSSPANAKDKEVVYKAIAGFVGFGALAAALRGYMATQQGMDPAVTDGFKKAPRTTTNAPVGEEDLEKAEKGSIAEKETDLDVLAGKLPALTAAGAGAIGDAAGAVYGKGRQLYGKLTKGASGGDWAQLALPVAGGAAGALLGYNIVDTASEDINKKKLTAETAKKEALLRQLVAARALNARGMLDEPTFTKIMGQVNQYMPAESVVKTASADKQANFLDQPVGKLYGLAGALLATSFAVSAYISKRQADANDPSRVKMKAYREGLKQYANEKMLQSPIVVGSPEEKVLKTLDNPVDTPQTSSVDFEPRIPVSIPL